MIIIEEVLPVQSYRRMAIHPLPADAERREAEIRRVERNGYRLLELYREFDGSWWGRFQAPDRVAC